MIIPDFKYSSKDLQVQISFNSEISTTTTVALNCQDGFDKILSNAWKNAQDSGLFRYKLGTLPFRVVPGKYQFILQLNTDRAEKRRKPQEITSVNHPFNPHEFNFSKVKPEEIILQLNSTDQIDSADDEHVLLINVSPLEFGHVLLTPFRSKCRPQIVSPDGLKLAIELILLSRSCDFRVGFNSLCGYASVNHEHYHAYYLSHRLYLESAELKLIKGLCYELTDYPGSGFAFVLTDLNELQKLVDSILRLTSFFQSNEIAHNIFITRGSSKCQLDEFDSLRVYVWARSSAFGAKECFGFNPALCELGGHFPCKEQTAYNSLTEETITSILKDICEDSYANVRKVILDLL